MMEGETLLDEVVQLEAACGCAKVVRRLPAEVVGVAVFW